MRPTWPSTCRPEAPAWKNHVQVRYLGYYEKWHPRNLLLRECRTRRLPPHRRTQGTYSQYNSMMMNRRLLLLHHLHQVRHRPLSTYDAAGRSGRGNHLEGKALCKSLTALVSRAAEKRSSSICPWTASTSRGPASCLNSPKWTVNTLCTWPTVSAVPTFGNGTTTCGNCVTPPTRATAKCFGATRRAPTTKYKAKGNTRIILESADTAGEVRQLLNQSADNVFVCYRGILATQMPCRNCQVCKPQGGNCAVLLNSGTGEFLWLRKKSA